MTTNLAREYGPDKPCKRTTCADGSAHLGGAHIDPRSALYDGQDTTVNALPMAARDACRALLAAGASVPEVVDLAQEIHRLRRQVAAVQVDKDRQVRAASERALDCEAHGKDIRRLEEQVAHFEKAAEQNNAGRLALLGGLGPIEDAIRTLQEAIFHGDPVPDLKTVLGVLSDALVRTHAAHKRAWSK
jgi:hypothetical protein